jgi:putative transposase
VNYHFLWCPKRRRKILVNKVERDLRALLQQQTAALDCHILALEIMPDHVHLFVNCPPTEAPSDIMFFLKGYTSRILREKYPHLDRMSSLWTRSYFVSTAGNVSSVTVERYISEQKTR